MLHGKKFDRLTVDLWPWKSTGFQTLVRTKYVPSLVKIHWRMLILECSQGCYTVKNLPSELVLWPRKSIGFQTLLRSKYVPSLVKIHCRMLILVFTRMLCGKNLTRWPWPLTLKNNRVPDSLKDSICIKFGQNPLKDVDPRVFTRMLWKDGSVTISLRNFVGEGIITVIIIFIGHFQG